MTPAWWVLCICTICWPLVWYDLGAPLKLVRKYLTTTIYGTLPDMKTTLEIDDTLFREAKAFAAHRGMTMRSLYEQALRVLLHQRQQDIQPFTLCDARVEGKGLQAGVDLSDPTQWHELVYPAS